jgi:hypothetical protein
VEAEHCPEWSDTADCRPIYKSYWAQWNSMVVRDGVLKRQSESIDEMSKTVQIVLPRSKAKEILGDLHGESSGRHLCINETLEKAR